MNLKKFVFSHWLIILIIIAAAFIRFWRLETLTTFGGDQGYDFLIVKRMIVDQKFTLLGPKIGPYNNIGQLFLGPAYYYIIAPSLFFTNYDPIGPAILTVILSIFTLLLIYLVATKFYAKPVAIIASLLFASNPLLIDQSRAPSNPHMIPFFSALGIFFYFLLIKKISKSFLAIFLIGFSAGILFQLHYIAVSQIIAIIVFTIFRNRFVNLFKIVLGFLVAISPQILFEIRHGFFITNEFLKQLNNNQNFLTTNNFFQNLKDSIENLFYIILHINGYYVLPIVLIMLVGVIVYLLKNREKTDVVLFLVITIIINLFLLGFYSQGVNLHYLSPSYVALILIFSISLVTIYSLFGHFLIKAFILLLVFQMLMQNLLNLNLNRLEGYTMPKGWNLVGIKKASKIIVDDVNDFKKFNIAATLDGDTRARPYRYLVDINNKKPLDVEQYPESDILYLISRDTPQMIENYTVWEVAVFKPIKIEKTWSIQNGIHLYRLSKADKES